MNERLSPLRRLLSFKQQLDKATGKILPGDRVFHGTESRHLIHQQGFKPSSYGWLGQGVYTSPDKNVAREFGFAMGGRLPPGTRLKDYPGYVHATEMFGEKGQFSKKPGANIGIPEGASEARNYLDFDNKPGDLKKFRKYDGIRWRLDQEDQILLFDKEFANTVFDTDDGPKAGPRSTRMPIDSARKHLGKDRILKTLLVGSTLDNKRTNGLASLLTAGLLGQSVAGFMETGMKRYNEAKAERERQRIPESYAP